MMKWLKSVDFYLTHDLDLEMEYVTRSYCWNSLLKTWPKSLGLISELFLNHEKSYQQLLLVTNTKLHYKKKSELEISPPPPP